MSIGDIRAKDPDEIKGWVQAADSCIAEYKNVVEEEFLLFDETSQLCEAAKQAVLSDYEELSERAQSGRDEDGETCSKIQGEIEKCRLAFLRLAHYAEEVDGIKRDTLSELACLQKCVESVGGLKNRVDALMDKLLDVR